MQAKSRKRLFSTCSLAVVGRVWIAPWPKCTGAARSACRSRPSAINGLASSWCCAKQDVPRRLRIPSSFPAVATDPHPYLMLAGCLACGRLLLLHRDCVDMTRKDRTGCQHAHKTTWNPRNAQLDRPGTITTSRCSLWILPRLSSLITRKNPEPGKGVSWNPQTC